MYDSPDTIMTIDVISDVVCPWCYIGKKRLDAALAVRPAIKADIRWRPYQLDPSIPPEGIDRQDYLLRKFGDPQQIVAMHQRISTQGAEEGIAFNFVGIDRSPNTFDAHRLIRWASEVGLGDEVVESLFDAYFIQGRDIGDHRVLLDLAERAGMRSEGVAKLLAGTEAREEVTIEILQAQQMGIQGVPCFIFASKVAVQGAHPTETLVQALDEALHELHQEADDEL
jgi:predicted DsbA family dithiol-disulfide isomerase